MTAKYLKNEIFSLVESRERAGSFVDHVFGSSNFFFLLSLVSRAALGECFCAAILFVNHAQDFRNRGGAVCRLGEAIHQHGRHAFFDGRLLNFV